ELVQGPARLCDADDRHIERAAAHHALERREDLLVREVARGAEEHERVRANAAPSTLASPIRANRGHRRLQPFFSTCPPNSKRIAERSLLAKSASPRESKRS